MADAAILFRGSPSRLPMTPLGLVQQIKLLHSVPSVDKNKGPISRYLVRSRHILVNITERARHAYQISLMAYQATPICSDDLCGRRGHGQDTIMAICT